MRDEIGEASCSLSIDGIDSDLGLALSASFRQVLEGSLIVRQMTPT